MTVAFPTAVELAVAVQDAIRDGLAQSTSYGAAHVDVLGLRVYPTSRQTSDPNRYTLRDAQTSLDNNLFARLYDDCVDAHNLGDTKRIAAAETALAEFRATR